MKRFKKIFTSAVMFMTVVVMSGLTAPATSAATAQAGDLIKKDGLSAVYYLGEDGKRYVFPNESTYKSWYSDFSGVVTVSADELASYPLGANVVVRPGTKLVKITTDPKVYAVEENGTLRWVQTEEDAIALYGENWASRVIDVADSFFTNYTIGEPLASDEVPQGSLVQKEGESEIYYFDGSDYRIIEDEVAFLANRFQFENVLTVNDFTPSGETITGYEASISKTSQGGQATGWQPGQGTGVTVALNSTTPAAQSVPSTVGRIPFTKVNVTASADGATHLESITVKRTGLTGEWTTFKVWAEKDGVAVTSKRALTSNDDAVLTFAPVLVIPAGQTATLEILAEVAGATGNGALGIASASAVSAAGATVSGSFPITGNLMSFTHYLVTEVNFATSTTNYNYKVGEEEVELGKFNVEISDNERDVIFDSLVLRNSGVEDLESVLMNVRLEANGEVVSENATFNGRYATFTLSDGGFEISKDDNRQAFTIKGDVIAKDNSSESVSLDLRLHKAEDISAYEKATGFGVSFAHGKDEAVSTVMIQSGAVTVSKKSTSPADTTVIKGSKNISALIANIRTDEAITADGLTVYYTDNSATENSFSNVKVYLNNALLGSFDTVGTSTEQSELIDSSLSLNKGDNEIKITVDVKSNATPEDFVKFSLKGTDLLDLPEYVSNGIQVDSDDISGTATGAQIDVEGGDLTVTRNDGYSSERTIVKGSNDVSLGKFQVKANNDAIKITNITLTPNQTSSTTAIADSSVYDMKLFVDGVQIGTTRNFNSGATFSSLNYSVGQNSVKILELKGSFDSTATGTFQTIVKVNGQDSLGKSINEKQATTTDFIVKKEGELIVEFLNQPAGKLLASKAGVEQEVAQFKFTAVDDSASITEINVMNAELVSTTTATSTADARIQAVKLYDGSTLVDEIMLVDGEGTFNINNSVVVNANASKSLSVKLVLNDIDNDANATNKAVSMRIVDVKSRTSSGSTITTTVGKSANDFLIRKTVPTVGYEALSDTNLPLTATAKTVAKFNVTADANGDLEVGKFILGFAKSTNAVVGTSTTPLKVGGSNVAASAAIEGDDKLVITLDVPEIVSAGTSKVFEVITNVNATGSNSEEVSFKISEDADYIASSTLSEFTTSNFVWSDGASLTTKTWNTGKNVSGLDTAPWKLSR